MTALFLVVPSGYCLGSTSFYYSNGDINCDISYSSIVSFDDDTILYHGISNVDDILQNDLYLYMIWLLVII